MSDNRIEREIAKSRSRSSDEFKDRTCFVLFRRLARAREKGIYLQCFHRWPLDQRKAGTKRSALICCASSKKRRLRGE
jgi:hypothetical protein